MNARYFLFAAFLFPSIFFAQTTFSDCAGAITLCGDLYSEEESSFSSGDVYEFTGTCNQGVEQNSVWYTFTVQSDGFLSFTLTPNNGDDDYDLGLFDITNGGCDGITLQDGTSPEVNCNSWGTLTPPNGPTGISTAQGGISNVTGPGDLNGPPFNSDLPVLTGQTYALVVMNWSNSVDGYSIDFGESTASLYDNVQPVPLSVTGDCSNTNFTIHFSEPILLASVDASDFAIEGNGTTYQIANYYPVTSGASLDDSIVVSLDFQIPEAGIYTLTFTDSSGFITDACGNLIVIQTFDFELFAPLTFSTQALTACNGTGGAIEFESASGGLQPYLFYVDGVIQPDLVGDGLDAGAHSATIIDENDCVATLEIIVPDTVFTFETLSTVACNGFGGAIEIINVTGGTPPYNLILDGEAQSSLMVDSLGAGLHTAELDDNGVCLVTLSVEVPDNPIEVVVPEQDTLNCQNPIITVTGATAVPSQNLNYTWIAVSENGLDTLQTNSATPELTQPGNYILVGVNPDNGCNAQVSFVLLADTTFEIDFSQIIFPNVFSPNNDGKNDTWTPFLSNDPNLNLGLFFKTFDLQIFNRWGNLVFAGSQNNTTWTGKDALNGEYLYTLKYKLDCGIKVEGSKSGAISLLK